MLLSAALWRRAVLAYVLLLCGCATAFDNAPRNRPSAVPPAPLLAGAGRAAEDSGETAIALSA